MSTYEERRQDLIDIIKVSNSIDMVSWSSNSDEICSLEDLHTCGNAACIGGHLALSPMFIEAGGYKDDDGCPIYVTEDWVGVADYLDTNTEATHTVIFGGEDGYHVFCWGCWEAKEAIKALELLYAYSSKPITPEGIEDFRVSLDNIYTGVGS